MTGPDAPSPAAGRRASPRAGQGRGSVQAVRRALQLLGSAPQAPTLALGRGATMLDFDRLTDVLPELGSLAVTRRTAFLTGATFHRAEHEIGRAHV